MNILLPGDVWNLSFGCEKILKFCALKSLSIEQNWLNIHTFFVHFLLKKIMGNTIKPVDAKQAIMISYNSHEINCSSFIKKIDENEIIYLTEKDDKPRMALGGNWLFRFSGAKIFLYSQGTKKFHGSRLIAYKK